MYRANMCAFVCMRMHVHIDEFTCPLGTYMNARMGWLMDSWMDGWMCECMHA